MGCSSTEVKRSAASHEGEEYAARGADITSIARMAGSNDGLLQIVKEIQSKRLRDAGRLAFPLDLDSDFARQ